MSTSKRIQAIIDCEERTPIKDAAGIITPEGIDSKVRIDTLLECLKIAKSEESKTKC
jgi:hypothetical protein